MADNVNLLLNQLLTERAAKYQKGIYHLTQVSLAYNSNRIEGSQLSHEHTMSLFDTRSILANENEIIKSNDIIETLNHFRAFDYCLLHYSDKLTDDFIKHIHKLLKTNTTDADLEWFAVGEYKKMPNLVGNVDTVSPSETPGEMASLLCHYQLSNHHTLQDILSFHVKFESIHPFQDGNGRVGRLLLFKECLKFGLIPFIIDEAHKLYYYRGIREFHHEPGYLTDTCLSAQDKYIAYCQKLVPGFSISLNELRR